MHSFHVHYGKLSFPATYSHPHKTHLLKRSSSSISCVMTLFRSFQHTPLLPPQPFQASTLIFKLLNSATECILTSAILSSLPFCYSCVQPTMNEKQPKHKSNTCCSPQSIYAVLLQICLRCSAVAMLTSEPMLNKLAVGKINVVFIFIFFELLLNASTQTFQRFPYVPFTSHIAYLVIQIVYKTCHIHPHQDWDLFIRA